MYVFPSIGRKSILFIELDENFHIVQYFSLWNWIERKIWTYSNQFEFGDDVSYFDEWTQVVIYWKRLVANWWEPKCHIKVKTVIFNDFRILRHWISHAMLIRLFGSIFTLRSKFNISTNGRLLFKFDDDDDDDGIHSVNSVNLICVLFWAFSHCAHSFCRAITSCRL